MVPLKLERSFLQCLNKYRKSFIKGLKKYRKEFPLRFQ